MKIITIRGETSVCNDFHLPYPDPIRFDTRPDLSGLIQFLHRVDIPTRGYPPPRGSIGRRHAVPQPPVRRHTCMRMHIHVAHTWRRRRGGWRRHHGPAYEFSIKPRKFPTENRFRAASVWGGQFNDIRGVEKG